MAEVVSTSPYAGETEVYIGDTVSVTFDESMRSSSINARTFVVYGQDLLPLEGTYTYTDATLTAVFTPSSPFLTRSQYNVVLIGNSTTDGILCTREDVYGPVPLRANYSFYFITNDGRFAVVPSGIVNPASVGVTYPSGVTYDTPFALLSVRPDHRETNIDPSGVYLDGAGNPTIRICFNKPVDILTIDPDISGICLNDGITVTMRDVDWDPYVPTIDLVSSGYWDVLLWQATLRMDHASGLGFNREVEIYIPSTVAGLDGTTLGTNYTYYFTTQFDPLYIGANRVRLALGEMLNDVSDDTLNRLIHVNSLLANWYSNDYKVMIQPFESDDIKVSELSVIRPSFTVDPVTGAPLYVKEYVLAKTMLDILKAKFLGEIDGILVGGGPGASKSLADLKITQGGIDAWRSTFGPLIDMLEDDKKRQGSVAYWKSYITGEARMVFGLMAVWGQSDATAPASDARTKGLP
jgi:hypothetical protein